MQSDSPPTPKGEEPARRREPRVTDSRVGLESGVPWNGTFVGWEAESGKLDPRATAACSTLREVQGLWLGTLSRVHGAGAANPITLSSCPSDLAASGNDEGALTAQGGGEGEPHRQSPDTLLGNTDKELNAGAAVTSRSAGAAPVAPCQREPGDLVMEPGLWGTCLGKAKETPFPKKRWTMERSRGSLERNICPARPGIVWPRAWGKVQRCATPRQPVGGRFP